jgi:acetylglutamate kinase
VPLNINADYAAAAIAGALGARELLLVSDVGGVLIDGAVQPTLDSAEAAALVARGIAVDGMATKLRAATRALSSGARAVRIGDLRMLTEPAAGTRVLAATRQPA